MPGFSRLPAEEDTGALAVCHLSTRSCPANSTTSRSQTALEGDRNIPSVTTAKRRPSYSVDAIVSHLSRLEGANATRCNFHRQDSDGGRARAPPNLHLCLCKAKTLSPRQARWSSRWETNFDTLPLAQPLPFSASRCIETFSLPLQQKLHSFQVRAVGVSGSWKKQARTLTNMMHTRTYAFCFASITGAVRRLHSFIIRPLPSSAYTFYLTSPADMLTAARWDVYVYTPLISGTSLPPSPVG